MTALNHAAARAEFDTQEGARVVVLLAGGAVRFDDARVGMCVAMRPSGAPPGERLTGTVIGKDADQVRIRCHGAVAGRRGACRWDRDNTDGDAPPASRLQFNFAQSMLSEPSEQSEQSDVPPDACATGGSTAAEAWGGRVRDEPRAWWDGPDARPTRDPPLHAIANRSTPGRGDRS
eukprot:gene16901-1105_t